MSNEMRKKTTKNTKEKFTEGEEDARNINAGHLFDSFFPFFRNVTCVLKLLQPRLVFLSHGALLQRGFTVPSGGAEIVKSLQCIITLHQVCGELCQHEG